MVISELLSRVRDELSENAQFEARQLVKAALGMTDAELIINSKSEVPETAEKKVMQMAARRKNGEPLQYILGTAEFMSLEFEVNKSTLIPRADTETLVETVLGEIGGKKVTILDIGTGCGCIGISLAYYTNADVTLADISRAALQTAARNSKRNGVETEILNIDILNEIPRGKYDIVVSNPPYIETDVIKTLQTEVKDHEPLSALDGGEDGLMFYRRIIEIAPDILNENGFLAFEIGYNQGEALSELMSADFEDVKVIRDLCGNERVVTGYKK